MTATESPAALERSALSGDRTAWNSLVKRHNARVVTALLASGVRLAIANELAQDTWVRLMQQAAAGRLERIELPGLAIRQALFLARTHARNERPPESMEIGADEATGEVRLLNRESLNRAAKQLASCSAINRRVFTLAYAEQLTHAEIAVQVGLSTQRVKQIVCEVRAFLRRSLEGNE